MQPQSMSRFGLIFALATLLAACGGAPAATSGGPSPAPAGAAAPTQITPTAVVLAPIALGAPASPTAAESTPQPTPSVATYQVVNTYPHDAAAFTQGLVYEGGFLYEGTGLNGKSELRRVVLETGEVVQCRALADAYFGEGITIVGDRIFQLTWKSHVGFIYDRASFDPLGQFQYPSEGWGLTHDDSRLIMSDGTATLHFLDPQTLQETSSVQVRDGNSLVTQINELEYINGEIYANIWHTDMIARIAPQTGQVLGWIDLAGLLSPAERQPPVDVLNGIAYDATGDRLFVTGKRWPKLFEIKVVDR